MTGLLTEWDNWGEADLEENISSFASTDLISLTSLSNSHVTMSERQLAIENLKFQVKVRARDTDLGAIGL